MEHLSKNNVTREPSPCHINGDVIKISSASQIENVANCEGVQPGDLLYFSNDGATMHHATIVSKVSNGEIYFAAHSNPQFDCSLSSKIGKETIYIIRIYDDA